MHRNPHILNAASNLLGICFVIIGALKLTGANSRSYSDELVWLAAFLLLVSVLSSYTNLRNNTERAWRMRLADYTFIMGIVTLSASVILAAIIL